MRKLFFLFVFVLAISNLRAQYFQTGQDPASIKWRQINTKNFQLIYPDYYELQAQKLANIMEKVYTYKSNSIQFKPKKISIILHTQTVQSNGLVAWAPKRSEFYTTPHQAIYPQDWLEQLALHEFRHVVQIDKVNSEIPKIIKILLGEQGTAGIFGLYIPWWFIEGDAVVTETALSNFGRGRYPSFLMEHKAQVVEKGKYKYDKAYNGSIKDYVPDHYQLGYYLVGASREKYGADLWDTVLYRVGRKPLSLRPFNKALKSETGLNKVKLYNSIFEDFEKTWLEEDLIYQFQFAKQLSKTRKTYTNYNYNHWLNDSTIVAYKTSLNKTASFVLIDYKGKEKNIFKPGRIFDESANSRGDWLVWSEQKSDLRWSHSGVSLIRLRNIITSKKYTIKPKFKAFAPAISPSFEEVIVVETDFSSNYYLSVYNINNGQLIHRIQTKNNNYLFSPEWINDDEVVAVVLVNEGKRLARFNLNSGKMEFLTNRDLGEIKNLNVQNEHIFFISSYSGKNSLYDFNLSNNTIQQIYEPRFGAAYPAISPNGHKMIFSDYTADGFRILQTPYVPDNSIPLENIKAYKYKLADDLAAQESGVIDFSKIDTVNYDSKRYRKTTHLFNFHSWAPLSLNVDSYEFTPGISFMSQNKLSTAITTLGYEWDYTEKTGKFFGKYSFKGWYPIFDLEINHGKRASEYRNIQEITNRNGEVISADTTMQRFTWKQTYASIGSRIPFNLSRGKYYRLFQPEVIYDYTIYGHDESTPHQFYEGDFQSFSYRLYYQQSLRQSLQDVYPNFGFIFEGNYYHTPTGQTDLGSMEMAQSYLFLPGFMANHGMRFYAGYQEKQPGETYGFSDVIRYPRGWGKLNTIEMSSFAFDYKLPLFYPEWNVGGLVYLKRITTSVFADYANLNGNYYEDGEIVGTFSSAISSYGVEMMGDMHFLRFYAPLKMGIRASYLPEIEYFNFDFLFSIDFNSL